VWFSAVQDMSSGDEGQDDFFAVPHNIQAAFVDAGAPAAAVAEGASGPLASAEVGSAVGVVPEWFRQWRPKARKAAAMARAIEFAAARDVEPAASKPARGKGAAGAAGGAKAGTSKGKKRQRPAPAAGVAEPGSPKGVKRRCTVGVEVGVAAAAGGGLDAAGMLLPWGGEGVEIGVAAAAAGEGVAAAAVAAAAGASVLRSVLQRLLWLVQVLRLVLLLLVVVVRVWKWQHPAPLSACVHALTQPPLPLLLLRLPCSVCQTLTWKQQMCCWG
jgi:hypothetical protein